MNKINLLSQNLGVIAHRGASAHAPENTLAAMQQAKNLNASWVEFDVMLSADDTPVIIHDHTLERTTNGAGTVAQKNYTELEKLDAGSWFSKEFKDEKIPKLDDALTLLKQLKLNINLEIKPNDHREAALTASIIHLLHQHDFYQTNCVLISSFSKTALMSARQLHPTIPLGLCLHQWEPEWNIYAKQLNCSSIHLHESLITADRIQHIKSNQHHVLSYTINDKQRAQQLHDLGVDAIFTDDVTLFNN